MHRSVGQEQSPPSKATTCALGLTAGRTCPPQNASSLLLPPLAPSPCTGTPVPSPALPEQTSMGFVFIRGGVCGYCPGAMGKSHPSSYPSPWDTQPRTCSHREAWLCSGTSQPRASARPPSPLSSDQHFKHVHLIQSLSNKSTFKHFLTIQSFSMMNAEDCNISRSMVGASLNCF